jgi:hypothetical protein
MDPEQPSLQRYLVRQIRECFRFDCPEQIGESMDLGIYPNTINIYPPYLFKQSEVAVPFA